VEEGIPLSTYIRDKHWTFIGQRETIAHQIVSALHHTNALLGVHHGDFHPRNIVIVEIDTKNFKTCLIDWETAIPASQVAIPTLHDKCCLDQAILPEILFGSSTRPYPQTGDMYMLAFVLIEIILLQNPFQVFEKHVTKGDDPTNLESFTSWFEQRWMENDRHHLRRSMKRHLLANDDWDEEEIVNTLALHAYMVAVMTHGDDDLGGSSEKFIKDEYDVNLAEGLSRVYAPHLARDYRLFALKDGSQFEKVRQYCADNFKPQFYLLLRLCIHANTVMRPTPREVEAYMEPRW
jgi:hypothetical protein